MADNDNNLVFTVSSDLTPAQRGLKRFTNDIGAATDQIARKYQAAGTKIDASTSALQARIEKMAGISTRGAKEWTGALADQGKELERLRARYSPLFATINNYKSAVSDIRRAHAVGAISATEMTAAIQRERQAALASTAAIKGRNQALAQTPGAKGGAGQGLQTANIAAQFQDIAVTSAMGMSPLQIALQQGTQLSAVLGPMGATGAVKGLGAAFLSVISPVSLVTIGLVAGSAALIQYISSSKGVKSADDLLKGHAETIALLKERYGEAASGLKEYARESTQVAKADLDQRLKDAREFVNEQAKLTASFGPGLLTENASTLKDMDPKIVRELRTAFADLNTSIQRGEPDILRFREALSRIANDESAPASIRKLAGEYRQFDEDTLKVAKSIPGMLDQMKLIEGVANGQTDAINKLAGALRDLNKIGIAPLTELQEAEKLWRDARRNAENREQRDDADTAYREAVRRVGNLNPTIVNGDGRTVSVPTPGAKPIQLGEEPNKKTETAATRAANAYRDLIKSADDRIAQLRLESELTGEYGVATDAARFRLELLQQAEDKGRSLSEAQRAQIEEKVAAYEKYSQALSQAKLQQDLLDDAVFAGMSKQEQSVKQRLRSYGLSEDMGGQNAAAIRDQFQREELSDLTQSFLSEFTTGVVSGGKSIGESFADAIKNAAANAMQKSLDSLFTQIGNAFAGAVFGSKGGGAASSALSAFPAAPSSLASAFAAPVGAVSRGALPAAGTSKTGIGLSTISTAGGLTADVNAKFASQFQSLVNDLEATGYQIKSIGGYNHRNIAGTNKLSNHAYGNAIDINPQANPMGRNLVTDMPTGVSAIAARNGFNWGGDWKSKKDAMHFEISQAKSAGEALEKLAGASTETTKGLSSLATNLTSAGGGGKGIGGIAGGFDWGSLFSPSWKPNTTLSNVINGVPGFAKGTNFAPGGLAIVGENGPELVNLPRGSQVTPNHRLNAPRAPRLNGRSSPANNNAQPGILQVNINGASGDPHVRELVRQGVGEALAAQNKNMERGGFGTMQARYGNQKG